MKRLRNLPTVCVSNVFGSEGCPGSLGTIQLELCHAAPRILSSAASMPAFKWISMEEAMPPSSVRLGICHCPSAGEEQNARWCHQHGFISQRNLNSPKNHPKHTSTPKNLSCHHPTIYIHLPPQPPQPGTPGGLGRAAALHGFLRPGAGPAATSGATAAGVLRPGWALEPHGLRGRGSRRRAAATGRSREFWRPWKSHLGSEMIYLSLGSIIESICISV